MSDGPPSESQRRLGSWLVGDGSLEVVLGVLPPREITLQGVTRTPDRPVTVIEAKQLVERGLPVVVVGFDVTGLLPPNDVAAFFDEFVAWFDFDEHGPESQVFVYGRRRGTSDTRLVVPLMVLG